MSCSRRRGMVEKNHPRLGIARQCDLLGLWRSTYYYAPQGEPATNLLMMRKIDEQFLESPFFGSRQMARWLRMHTEFVDVDRKRVDRLMRLMGLAPIYQKPNTSRPHPQHKRFPYLLKDFAIVRPNQVWCADVTYIPMRRGFLYFATVMDWHSRKVLSWRLSNSLEADFCVEALKEAPDRFGRPEIFKTDQGCQFTSFEFVETLKDAGIRISMDSKGRWMDNVMIERLWRSMKYENINLNAYETGSEARTGLGNWIDFYHRRRPHSSLDDRTPDQPYWQHDGTGTPVPTTPMAAA